MNNSTLKLDQMEKLKSRLLSRHQPSVHFNEKLTPWEIINNLVNATEGLARASRAGKAPMRGEDIQIAQSVTIAIKELEKIFGPKYE